MRKIYLATSWRNEEYPEVLKALRAVGHKVYDFRTEGFQWDELEPGFATTLNTYWPEHMAKSPRALEHFSADKGALDWCDTLVLLLPCGRSAHTEAGYAAGQGKEVVLVIPQEPTVEPELMYLLFDRAVFSLPELTLALSSPVRVMKVASSGVDQYVAPQGPLQQRPGLVHTGLSQAAG